MFEDRNITKEKIKDIKGVNKVFSIYDLTDTTIPVEFIPDELKDMNDSKYGVINFFDYPEEPIIENWWKRGERNIPIYELNRIAGTVISKNDVRHSITLLTKYGVVPVKFNRDMYAMYKRQLSEVQPDGTKKIVEKGWFTRGTMLIINGFRRDDMFVAKKYAKTQGHTVYKITEINENGDIKIENERGKN